MSSTPLSKPMLIKILRTLRNASALPPDVINIAVLSDVTDLPELPRSIILYNRLTNICQEQVQLYRPGDNPVELTEMRGPEDVIRSLKWDFLESQNAPVELFYWSTLLHRYFVPMTYQSVVLAKAIGTSRRQFDRYTHAGIDRLLWKLIQIGMENTIAQ